MVKKKEAKKVAKRGVKKGDVYKCGVCGLAVTVDEVCGCAGVWIHATSSAVKSR